jgi:tetratricopeptide (TPR) repeat protein
MTKLFEKVGIYLLYTSALLFAVFVLPQFPVSYAIPKEIFGVVMVSLILIFWSIKSIIKGETKFLSGKFDLPVILLTLSYIISAIVRTPNKMEAFFYPGSVTIVILSLLFYLLVNQIGKKAKDGVLTALFFSGILLSLSTLFTQLGIFAKISFLPAFMKEATFNPLGGSLQSAVYLAALLPIGIAQIIKGKDTIKKIFFGVSSTVIIFGAVLLGINLMPEKTQTPILPTMQTSWEITVEALKASPIWGVGPGNYLTAFNLYRPVAYNQTELWNVRFSSANNFYFTLITELGLVGLAAMAILLVSIYRKLRLDLKLKSWEEVSVAVLIFLFAVFPSAPATIFLSMMLLAVFSGSEEKTMTISTNKVPTIIVTIPVFAAIIALGIFGTKAVAAEITYKKSLDAISMNDAKTTYDLMTKATQQNKYVDRYHASLAQIDMALATSIASQKELSDADRSTVTQLIQQAITQGKATVTLNQGRSGNWEVLAQIYRSIMSFATGADQFALEAYTQAVALDPINPNLRISLGGVYYALGDYDNAVDSFKFATLAKPDLANAHYNLAIAYREKKNYDAAITEMNTVINLVDKDSSDYTLAKTTLEDLEKNRTTTAKDAESLTSPTKQTTVVEPPIDLPQEATPPASN